MPLYDYSCAACGDFREWRSLAESADPAPCPRCAAPAPRAISAPYLTRMSRGTRIAHERNERSAYEPDKLSMERTATAFSQMFASSNPFWAVAGNVAQTIFDGGTLLHRQRAAEAAFASLTSLTAEKGRSLTTLR